MNREQLSKYITDWNVRYPYDKIWREKHKVPLFSKEHRNMVLLDIYMEKVEDDLYKDAREKYLKEKKAQEEAGVTAMRDVKYIRGAGNWLNASEDSMSESEQDALFNKINF